MAFRHAALALVFSCVAAFSKTVRYDMRDAGLRNVVQAVSDAPLEKMIALSGSPAGWIELDPERLTDGIRGEFEIDVRTFSTGLDPRDEKVRDAWLGSSEHPTAGFQIAKVLGLSKAKLTDGQPVVARLEGQLRLRGVARNQPVLAKLTYVKESDVTRQRLPGNLLRVSATFDLDTGLFNLPIPEPFRNRLSRYIQVAADLVGTDRPPVTLK